MATWNLVYMLSALYLGPDFIIQVGPCFFSIVAALATSPMRITTAAPSTASTPATTTTRATPTTTIAISSYLILFLSGLFCKNWRDEKHSKEKAKENVSFKLHISGSSITMISLESFWMELQLLL